MPAEQLPPPGPLGDGTHDAPIPVSRTDDLERGNKELGLSPSRSYLPDSASMHSHRTDIAGGDQGNADDTNSEFPWGPKHPCFPHPNPHVPLDSPLYHNTRIIRISRDWMQKGDLAPTFQNLYPEVLDPLIEEDAFRVLIKHINDTLIEAFDPLTFRAWLDSVMGVATFWLWDDIGLTKVKRKLAELEKWIEKWNQDIGEKEGVKIIALRRTGYMTLDIQVPDPQFVVVPVSEHDDMHDEGGQNPESHQQSGDPYTHTPTTPTLQVHTGSPASAEARS